MAEMGEQHVKSGGMEGEQREGGQKDEERGGLEELADGNRVGADVVDDADGGIFRVRG